MVRDASGERAARMQWDERHRSGDFEGSGPNGTMVDAVGGWEPARALELACGSGTNAVWLARQGWQVTAVDWSPVALSNAQRQAHDAGVRISLLEKNLFDWTPPESAFELVLAVYLSAAGSAPPGLRGRRSRPGAGRLPRRHRSRPKQRGRGAAEPSRTGAAVHRRRARG